MEGCQTLEQEIYRFLWAEQQSNVVGITGDSNPDNTSEWVEIVGVSSPPTSSGVSIDPSYFCICISGMNCTVYEMVSFSILCAII